MCHKIHPLRKYIHGYKAIISESQNIFISSPTPGEKQTTPAFFQETTSTLDLPVCAPSLYLH